MTPLPKGLIVSDTKYPRNYKDHEYSADFELWHVGDWGWCIPTLMIRNVPRRRLTGTTVAPRTYAVRVDNGGLVRIGLGPHVKERVTVYGRKSRMAALKKFLDLRNEGAAKAGQVRDRISTRRARTALRGGMFGGIW